MDSKSKYLACLAIIVTVISYSNAKASKIEVISYSDAPTMGLQGAFPSRIIGNTNISGDGRYIAFDSMSANMAPGDTNGANDVFVHDRISGTNVRASVSTSGVQANGTSYYSTISSDGRYVAFVSSATNLVPSDTNGVSDIFVRDLVSLNTSRVSISSLGAQSNGSSYSPVLSSNGTVVVFESHSTNFSALDINGAADVYLHNRLTGQTILVSATSSGNSGNGISAFPAVSGDGSKVAFASSASDLIPGDTNNEDDVFFVKIGSGVVRVSESSSGMQGNQRSVDADVSDDGNLVVFMSLASNFEAGDTNGEYDIFVRNLFLGTTTLVSAAAPGVFPNGTSFSPAISGDGSHASFCSLASNLVPADLTPMVADIFEKNLNTGTISIVSTSSNGTQGNDHNSSASSLSVDGNFVIFEALAGNLVTGDVNGEMDVFLKDRTTGITRRISIPSDEPSNSSSSACCGKQLSADGRYAVFQSSANNLVPSDTNAATDIFVHDRLQGSTRRVSVSSTGVEGNGASFGGDISRDGRYVLFTSSATNLVTSDTNSSTRDAFLHDLQSGQTTLVSVSSSGTQSAKKVEDVSLSATGRYVVFSTEGSLATPASSKVQIYVRDMTTGITTRESLSTSGTIGDSGSEAPDVTSDGRYVVFASKASNLVSSDTNAVSDIFLRDRQLGITARISLASTGTAGNGASSDPVISENGAVVVFESVATNLVTGDTNNVSDVFYRSVSSATTKRASVGNGGTEANGASENGAVSGDGNFVGFSSIASNLVAGDTNGVSDVFATNISLSIPAAERISVDGSGNQGEGGSFAVSLSEDGTRAVFDSTTEAAWTIDGGRNGLFQDIFWVDRD